MVSKRMRSLFVSTGVAATALLVATGCGGSDDNTSAAKATTKAPNAGSTISLVAYTTPREVYEELIPAFNETKEGEGVTFEQSYGASGEQSRAVEGGLKADVVALSLAPDVKRLVEADLVDADWSTTDTKGNVATSVVALVVRKGNPKGIKGFDDLLEDDVEVVTPNPFTSGGARWNLIAAYGAWTRAGDSHEEALDKLEQLLRNTPVQSKGAREALQVFAQGKGDVLISYENEAITAQQKGEDVEYIIPESTILIENPIAVTTSSENAEAAQAFVDFLLTPEAQTVFAEKGYRPVIDGIEGDFDWNADEPAALFTIEDVGGWDKVMDDFFDREKGSVAEINKQLGVPTDG
jgi:sulfate/thiosulfate-binding protein